MPVNLQAILDAPIIELDSIDSTNNYAMRLVDADTAQPGLTITANTQTQGKGQRGRNWADAPSASLLMSIITHPVYPLEQQFLFNAAATVAIAGVLQNLSENLDVRIKWPNDIIINDKKAGGVLIENVLRGSDWMYSIIGLGLNVNQALFPPALPYATSLLAEAGRSFDLTALRNALREKILVNIYAVQDADEVMRQYNSQLYRKNEVQHFSNGREEWAGIVAGVTTDGRLQVQLADGSITGYVHGTVEWVWGRG